MKLNPTRNKYLRKDESGIAILLALMLGLVLSAGASALLINQLYAKRLSSSESYQQISEAAALNGFDAASWGVPKPPTTPAAFSRELPPLPDIP